MPEWRFLGWLFEYGADDRVLDSLLVLGAVLVPCIGLVGRHWITELLAAGYVCAFLGYLVYNSL